MKPPAEDLERRRPVWEALSTLFLDGGLDDGERRRIAREIAASGYSRAEAETILWEEVFPVLKANLKSPAGQWAGFDLEWMEREIVSGSPRPAWRTRWAAWRPGGVARVIREEWEAVAALLPDVSGMGSEQGCA